MRKCKCPEGSPFHWRDDKTPSIFTQDKSLRQFSVFTRAVPSK